MKLKTIFKKVTAAALAATMVVGMAACGSGSETASSSDSAASSSGTEDLPHREVHHQTNPERLRLVFPSGHPPTFSVPSVS